VFRKIIGLNMDKEVGNRGNYITKNFIIHSSNSPDIVGLKGRRL
jgi:hypothetical protein